MVRPIGHWFVIASFVVLLAVLAAAAPPATSASQPAAGSSRLMGQPDTTSIGTPEVRPARPDVTPSAQAPAPELPAEAASPAPAGGEVGIAAMPVAVEDTYTVPEGQTLTVTAPGLLANDTGNGLYVSQLNETPYGATSFTPDGGFTFTPEPNISGWHTLFYNVTDADGQSPAVITNIQVYIVPGPNTAPVAADDAFTVQHDTTLLVDGPGVLANDSDAEGDDIVLGPISDASVGYLVAFSHGGFNYFPPDGFAGTVTLTYQAEDRYDKAQSNVATVTITVLNASPVAVDDAYAIHTDEVLSVFPPGVLTNDSDPDGDPLQVEAGSPTYGTVTVAPTGSFYYQPPAGFTGEDAFAYRVSDGVTFSPYATVRITVSAPETGEGPLTADDAYTTAAGEPLVIEAPGILANDTAEGGAALTVSATDLTQPISGAIQLSGDGGFTYTPDAGFIGTDSFTYRANDGGAVGNLATVTITVSAPNLPPVAVDDTYVVTQDTVLVIEAAGGPLANDYDPEGGLLTMLVKSDDPVNGQISGYSIYGDVEYTPAPGFVGTDTFEYRAREDTSGQFSEAATVTIQVVATAEDSPPFANDDLFYVVADEALVVDAPGLLVNDTDADGDPLSVNVGTITLPEYGQVEVSTDGSLVYQPDPGFVGHDLIIYSVTDGTAISNFAYVNIFVDAPEPSDSPASPSAEPSDTPGQDASEAPSVVPSGAPGGEPSQAPDGATSPSATPSSESSDDLPASPAPSESDAVDSPAGTGSTSPEANPSATGAGAVALPNTGAGASGTATASPLLAALTLFCAVMVAAMALAIGRLARRRV